MHDVAIIGLGPVGLTLALLLEQQGLSVVAIEQSTELHQLPRAIGLDHETMRIFQGLGLADAILPSTGVYCASEYRAADGSLLRRIVQAPGPELLAWPPNLTFIQPELDAVLLAAARRAEAIVLHHGVEVVDVVQHADGVTLAGVFTGLAGDERRPIEARARYLVGCDGASSFVRRTLEIPSEDLHFDEPWIVVDVILNPGVELPDLNIQVCDPARPMTYVRTPRDIRRFEIMLLPGEGVDEMTTPERIWSFLSRWVRKDQGTIWRAAAYRFHALVATRWRERRVLLAGDACHQTPPFLAQGLNQGLRDASNIAWKLAAVCQGRAPDSLLDTYEAERRANVRKVIEVTKGLGRIIGERDPATAQLRDAAMKLAVAEGRGELVRQELLPPLTGGLIGTSKGAGKPAPQPWVQTPDGVARLDDVVPRGWRVFLSDDCTADDRLFAAARDCGATVVRIGSPHHDGHTSFDELAGFKECDGVVRRWLQDHDAAVAIIVRPDHVVYASAGNAGALRAAMLDLAMLLGQGCSKALS